AHNCCEAREEHADGAKSADQLCAALDDPGKAIERPASEYLSAIAMPEPERKAVADNCAGHRRPEQRPGCDTGRGRERTYRKDQRGAGDHRPITGTASDSASRKTATTDSCGCAPTKSTSR